MPVPVNNREAPPKAGKWRKTATCSRLKDAPERLKPCSEASNERFSLFFLFKQESGPSIALTETGFGKLPLLGVNRGDGARIHGG